MNDVLKAKWLCRFANEDRALWKNVIKFNCGRVQGGLRRYIPFSGVDIEKSILEGLHSSP